MNSVQAAEMSQLKTLEVKLMEKVTLAEPPIKTADPEELNASYQVRKHQNIAIRFAHRLILMWLQGPHGRLDGILPLILTSDLNKYRRYLNI